MEKFPQDYSPEQHNKDKLVAQTEQAINDNLEVILSRQPLEISIHHKPVLNSNYAMETVWPMMSNLVDADYRDSVKKLMLMPVETNSNFTIPSFDGQGRFNMATLVWTDGVQKLIYRLANTESLGLISTVESTGQQIQANKISDKLTSTLVGAMGIPNSLLTSEKIGEYEQNTLSDLIHESESTTTTRQRTDLIDPYTQLTISQSVSNFHPANQPIDSGTTVHDSMHIKVQRSVDSGYYSETIQPTGAEPIVKFNPTVRPDIEEELRFERDFETGLWALASTTLAELKAGELPGETEYGIVKFNNPSISTLELATSYLKDWSKS